MSSDSEKPQQKAIDHLETPDFRLASDERRVLDNIEGSDRYQMMKLWFHEMIRYSDPNGRHEANVALTATKLKMGVYSPKDKAEMVDRILSDDLPDSFLADVKSLVRDCPDLSREAAYLNALKVFFLSNERWPCITELDRLAFEDHPEAFPNVKGETSPDEKAKTFSPDERRMFRRLRKKLGIDWLPKGEVGPKN